MPTVLHHGQSLSWWPWSFKFMVHSNSYNELYELQFQSINILYIYAQVCEYYISVFISLNCFTFPENIFILYVFTLHNEIIYNSYKAQFRFVSLQRQVLW